MDARGTFKIGASTYEVVTTKDMDYDEAQLVKGVTGGMSLGAYERGLADGDPDSWFAQAFIAIRRMKPNTTPEMVRDLLRAQPGGIVAIYSSVEKVKPEDDAIPPASQPPSGDGSSGDDSKNDEPEPSSLEATHATSGSQL